MYKKHMVGKCTKTPPKIVGKRTEFCTDPSLVFTEIQELLSKMKIFLFFEIDML